MTIHTDKLTTLFDKIETSINLRKEFTEIRYIKIYENILKALIKEGVIKSFTINNTNTINTTKIKNGMLKIYFNNQNEYLIKFKRISKSSKRVYITAKELLDLNSSYSKMMNQINKIYLISTSKGIMSNQEASLIKIGGEILTEITYKHENK